MRATELVLVMFLSSACGSTPMLHAPPARPAPAGVSSGISVYAPYRFLIGEWSVAPTAGGPSAAVARFRWGPNESYIWFSVATLEGAREAPQLEGMLMWNGARRDLDILLALEVDGRGVQEQGRLFLDADGGAVREITMIDAKGAQARFRQTFRAEAADRIATSVMRETPAGWVATFPGSERLVMTRRTG